MTAPEFLPGGTVDDKSHCIPSTPVLIPVFIAIIAVVGLLANTAVIFIVTVLREYQNSVTNIYVLQLAIADFIFLFQLPFQVQAMVRGQWTFGVTWCKMSEAIKMLNYYSSILLLTVMSIDRYLAINFAMNQKVAKFRSKTAAIIISCFIWILSILSIINILIYADVNECDCKIFFPGDNGIDYSNYNLSMLTYDGISGSISGEAEDDDYSGFFEFLLDDSVCSFLKPHISQYFRTWIICNFVLAFVVPLLVISISYALIIRRILRPMVIGTKSHKSNNTRKRVTIMVTALVSTFVVCWLPYHAFNLARLNGIKMFAQACDNITHFTIVFAYCNSAVNPFLYTFLGTNFRKRWGSAVGKARKGIRRSILSHSGEYIPGASFKGRRKSSAASTSTAAKCRDDMSVNSFVTKHTIVPSNHGVREDMV